MTAVQNLWLGYATNGERFTLDFGDSGSKVLLLGSKAGDMAALAALAAKEAGANPVVLDLGGELARSMSGQFDAYDYRSFLYDSFRLEEPGAWHSQLAAAAYAAALDLTSEEEAILDAAMQAVASEGTLLSPVSLHDVMGKVEGFRGSYVDRLKGRIGALRLFDATEDQSFGQLEQGNVIVDFYSAPYPQAAELSAALFLAKLLAISQSKAAPNGLLIITDAHRIFRATPRPAHSNRLLTHLVGWPHTVVISSGQQLAIAPLIFHSCPVKLYSSDAWHSQPGPVQPVLSGEFVLHDQRDERLQPFVPRLLQTKAGEYVPARGGGYPRQDLTRRVLEEIEAFSLATPESLANYFAPDFLRSDISSVLADLESRDCLVLEPKESGSGPRIFAYTLTGKGRSLLEELRG